MTFRQSRRKLALVAVSAVVAALLLSVFTFLSTYFPGLWAYMGASLFAPLALAAAVTAVRAAMALAHPAILTTDAQGLLHVTGGRRLYFAWSEIEAFTVFSPTARFRSPGMELKTPVNGRRFISFGRNWEKSAEEIVEAIRQERDRITTLP